MAPLEAYNDATGEVYDVVAQRRRQGRPYRYDWHTVSNRLFLETARGLRGADSKVFHALPALMRANNLVLATQVEIASATALSVASVSRALGTLRKLGVVRPVGAGALQFNPLICWRGRDTDFPAVCWEWNNKRR